MQNPDARVVRGVSIAVIVLSVLSAVVFLLGAIALGALGAFASDPSLYGSGISLDGYTHGHYDSLSPSAAAGLVGVSLGIAVMLLIWLLLCTVISLIAGIMGLRNHDKPEKLGGVFGWSIAGAIAALLSGRIITMVLLIVAIVYVSKLRNPAQPAYPQPNAYMPQPYPGQPGYGQPGYPQTAPQPQPVPQQPAPPVPPVPPEQQ